MNKYNLKEVLQVLYKDLESDDSDVVLQANEMIDRILTDNFNVSILSLFLYEIRNKDCIRNLRKLLIGLEVTDFEIAKALSSLVTHLIIATEKDIRRYHELRISEVILLLNGFITGEIDRPEIIEFFQDLL
jgi:hypothetical protein